MQIPVPPVMNLRDAGYGVRHGLMRLLGHARNLALAAWAIGVLAFCVMGLAVALH